MVSKSEKDQQLVPDCIVKGSRPQLLASVRDEVVRAVLMGSAGKRGPLDVSNVAPGRHGTL